MKVLVAIDLSDPSRAAIDEIAARPWPKGTDMCVLNIVDAGLLSDSPSLTRGEAASVIEMATDAARTLVEEGANRLAISGIATSTAVVQGHPRIDIVEYAEKWGADIVVVGSHGRSGLTRLLLGSVARTVTRQAPCSVEVIRSRTKKDSGGMKILLATDGSAYSDAAAQSVAERPWPQGAEVKIVSVVEVTQPPIQPFYVDPALAQSLVDEQMKQAQDAVSNAERTISLSHMKTSSAIPLGSPTGVILELAERWGADLVVVGSHGRHGIERLLLGSVSEAVALHAPCSIEVIRNKRSAA